MQLKNLRRARGLNMRQVAKELGIPYTTYVSYEKGDREPSLDCLLQLANFFGCSVDGLLGGTQEPEEKQEPDEAYKPERESRIRIIIDATPEEIAELFSRLKGGEVTSETSEDETSEDENSAGPSDVIAIRKNRQKFGLTQEGLAKILEVTKQAVSQWETGERKPDIVTLKHLAYIFGCTTDELLKDVDFRKGGTP